MDSTRRGDTAVSITRVEFEMDWPPGHVAAYVLDGEETVVFDAGVPPSDVEGDSFADRSGYALSEVDALVLTHPHPDHIGHVRALVEAADPVVYAPLTAGDRIRRPCSDVRGRARSVLAKSGFPSDVRERALTEEMTIRDRIAHALPLDAVDEWLADGERVEIGGLSVEAIETPGHQADHLCYRVDIGSESVLFSGDMGIQPFRAALLNDRLEPEYHRAVADYRAAIDRLEDVDVDRVYPGHGPIHADLAGALADDRASLERRLSGVEDVLADGPSTAADVVDVVAGTHDSVYLFPETLAALAALVDQGVAIRTEEDDGWVYRVGRST